LFGGWIGWILWWMDWMDMDLMDPFATPSFIMTVRLVNFNG